MALLSSNSSHQAGTQPLRASSKLTLIDKNHPMNRLSNMNQPQSKHLALWACPRSYSTLLTRSFEQRADCLVFDEPFYAAYLLEHGQVNPLREVMMELLETDYLKIIDRLKKTLPPNKISFQKHHPKNLLPHFGTSWIPNNHIFLLRHPEEMILSYRKCTEGTITKEDIGMEALYRFFQQLKSDQGAKILVIHADDLLKNPEQVLRGICSTFDIPFLNSMLSWEKGFDNSSLLFAGELLPYADQWYGSVKDSTGFRPYQKKNIQLPDELLPLREACMGFYQKMLPYCETFHVATETV